MPKLTDEHKAFIVQRLAMYDTPNTVSKAVREAFGLDVPANQVEGYDPFSHRAVNGKLGARWIALFHATREKFKEAIDLIPIADRAFRLRRLQAMHDKAFDKNQTSLAASLLEQAAKEVGESYSNKRKVEHSGEIKGIDELTIDDKRMALSNRIADALAAAATVH